MPRLRTWSWHWAEYLPFGLWMSSNLNHVEQQSAGTCCIGSCLFSAVSFNIFLCGIFFSQVDFTKSQRVAIKTNTYTLVHVQWWHWLIDNFYRGDLKEEKSQNKTKWWTETKWNTFQSYKTDTCQILLAVTTGPITLIIVHLITVLAVTRNYSKGNNSTHTHTHIGFYCYCIRKKNTLKNTYY